MKFLKSLMAVMILGAVFFTLAACQKIASPLEDSEWVLYRYGEPGNIKTPLPDTTVTAFFDGKEKIVSGSGGCNTYSGAYEVDHLTLKITGPLAVTEMSCGGEKDMQESAFLNALLKADSFEVERGDLIIHSGNNALYFKRTGTPQKTVNYWQE